MRILMVVLLGVSLLCSGCVAAIPALAYGAFGIYETTTAAEKASKTMPSTQESSKSPPSRPASSPSPK